MFYATYLVNYIPKEKNDLLGLDIDNKLYSNLEYVKTSLIPSTFPTVFNLYKNNKTKISEYIKTKLDTIPTDDLNGFGKIYDNINQLYKFNVFKPFLGEISTQEEEDFKRTFITNCRQSKLVILIGNIRNNNIEICNSITIGPEELSMTLPPKCTLVLGGFSRPFSAKLNVLRPDINIIFSTTISSWVDYEDIKVYLNYMDPYDVFIENVCNYVAIGELKLRKTLMESALGDYYNHFDNATRLIGYLETLYSSTVYNELMDFDGDFNKDLIDYVVFLEAEMMCFPFSFIEGASLAAKK